MKVGLIELGEPIMTIYPVPLQVRKGRWWERVQRWLAERIEHWSLALAEKSRKWQHRGEWQ